MNYLICLVLPPLGAWLSGYRKQVVLSILLFGLAITLFYLAFNGGPAGAYAAAPVMYILSVIHAFVFTHRRLQHETGLVHPHVDQNS